MLALIKISTGTKFVVHWADLIYRLALDTVRTVAADEAGVRTVDVKRCVHRPQRRLVPGGSVVKIIITVDHTSSSTSTLVPGGRAVEMVVTVGLHPLGRVTGVEAGSFRGRSRGDPARLCRMRAGMSFAPSWRSASKPSKPPSMCARFKFGFPLLSVASVPSIDQFTFCLYKPRVSYGMWMTSSRRRGRNDCRSRARLQNCLYRDDSSRSRFFLFTSSNKL
ncbi:hypothetical protein BC827DRAFT_202439 [Russula dissimulans]|nr:hypothetical protein BC827DRAFT_202439 [Russula dissimulans]